MSTSGQHVPVGQITFNHSPIPPEKFCTHAHGHYTCQLSRIMRESHTWGIETSISRIKDNFSHLTHKSGRVVLKKLYFISDLLCIIFSPYNNRKSFQMSTIRLNHKCSKVFGISSSIFSNVQKSSENRQKSSEVARTFPEIPIMTRQKSHAFDSEKVGRYRSLFTYTVLLVVQKRTK